MKTQYNWTRVNNDSNGNPRYVIHFLQCLPEEWKDSDLSQKYNAACCLMRKIGGKRFHNKQYGGGIVFSSYSLPELEQKINELKGETK